MKRETWGSDTPISMPVAPSRDEPPIIDFGGFAFTAGGISHNLTESDIEAIALPPFAPEDWDG